jgi:hypothetical protein
MLRLCSYGLILAGILLFNSCQEDPPTQTFPFRKDVPVLLRTQVPYYDLREVRFIFDLAIYRGDVEVNETNNVEDFTGLPDSSFRFTDYEFNGTWVRHTVDKVEFIDTLPEAYFSTIILIDQSKYPENFDSTDYYNNRLQSFNAFYKTLNNRGEVLFAYYNRTSTDTSKINYLNSDFSSSWESGTVRKLLDLTHQQEGTSSLFDALESAIKRLADHTSGNKSITLYVRNKDDGQSKLNLSEIITYAQSENVKINVIWLIKNVSNVDQQALRQLSSKTGGFCVYMSSIYQSNTVFLKLADLLLNNLSFYRVHATMTIGEPNYFLPAYTTGVFIYYYVSKFFVWSYVPLYFSQS